MGYDFPLLEFLVLIPCNESHRHALYVAWEMFSANAMRFVLQGLACLLGTLLCFPKPSVSLP